MKKPGDSGGLVGGDEGIRTLDLLSASYTRNPAVIEFQRLTACTMRNNAEETRNFRNLSATKLYGVAETTGLRILCNERLSCRSCSVGRHQAFEFFKPVEADVDLGHLLFTVFDH